VFLTGFSIFGTLVPTGYVAHAAHLGGILVGLGYVRFSVDLPAWVPWFGRRERAPAPGSLAKNTRRRRPHPEAQRASEFISREVGPILDKIAAQGLDSLTDKERKTLAAARQRMGKNAG